MITNVHKYYHVAAIKLKGKKKDEKKRKKMDVSPTHKRNKTT